MCQIDSNHLRCILLNANSGKTKSQRHKWLQSTKYSQNRKCRIQCIRKTFQSVKQLPLWATTASPKSSLIISSHPLSSSTVHSTSPLFSHVSSYGAATPSRCHLTTSRMHSMTETRDFQLRLNIYWTRFPKPLPDWLQWLTTIPWKRLLAKAFERNRKPLFYHI